MAVPKASATMPFIISTGVDKTDPEMRKFIRSHVMKGKNKGKSRYPRPEPVKSVRTEKIIEKPLDQSTIQCLSVIPYRVGGDFSFIKFADAVNPSMVANIISFSAIAKEVMFPLESCINFERKRTTWLEPLTNDALYLHAVVFSTQVYFDMLTGCQTIATGEGASVNFMKTLRYLRERLLLGKEKTKLSDPTVSVILSLMAHAHVRGEYEAARLHMDGLKKLVQLRGGLESFRFNIKLLIEVLRFDISGALWYGTKPMFEQSAKQFTQLSQHRFNTHESEISPGFIMDISSTLDHELSKVWCDMGQFCTTINSASKTKLPPEYLLQTMATVMYKLLGMKFEPDSIEEAIRFGLLAFSTHIFLMWRHVHLTYPWVTEAYRDSLRKLKGLENISLNLIIWLLMVGAITLFGSTDDSWLKPWLALNLETCGIKTWPDLRNMLKTSPWIDSLHNHVGIDIYESIVSMSEC